MIKSFKDRRARASFERRNPGKGFPANPIRAARRRLVLLDDPIPLADLGNLPGNRLEALKKDRVGRHSIRIDDQWRVCFAWTGRDAESVEIVDYHRGPCPMRADPLGPVHPGEILREDVLEPLGMSPYALVAHLRVPRTRIERLMREETPVTPDTALRLARYLGTTAEFWLRLQARYDLQEARQERDKDIAAIKPRRTARPRRQAAR